MDFVNVSQLFYIVRIFVAGLCGCLIGLERKNRSKEAGIRTHCVVACASALMMVISKYGFFDVGDADGARIAAQVVSGIGFLGAGMIFVHKNTVTGLTTAAGIWATSGVGLAVGSGMYIVGILATLLIFFAQIILHKNFKWLMTPKMKKVTIKDVDIKGYQDYITEKFKNHKINVYEVYVEKTDSGMNYTLKIDMPYDFSEESVLELIDFKCKISEN